ncbi:rhodanese-like domain-containing protein, partial [Thermoplasmatota archaeon]
VLITVVANSDAMNIEKISNRNFDISNNQGYIDISDQEAWELLSNTSNGIQFPIDVRTYEEWITERIDTPYPEYARLYTLSDLQNENGINHFKSVYTNKEVIIYCRSGGRSASAAQYLVSNEFNGTIYNMLGGITSWKQSGFPIKNSNQIPNTPEIILDSTFCYSNISCFFSTNSIDPDNDVIRYGWDWNGDDIVDEWTDHIQSGGILNISHIWPVLGNYDIKVLAEDIVGEKSDYSSTLTINVRNLAPNKPEISGINSGKNGKTYSYNISSIDQNGDKVYYWIQWYDDYQDAYWDGPYASNEIIIKNYSWMEEGIYTIKVKAKDIHDDESVWANYEVTMPKYKFDFTKELIKIKYSNFDFLFKLINIFAL